MTPTADPMPVLYLSHGAPPLADDTRWTAELAAWSAELPRPRNILMVSAHWESAPIAVSSTSGTTPLVYDFWGFPQKYYEVTYAAPGAPDLATSVAGLLAGAGEHLHQDPDRGLDHGAYVPLVEMFPEAGASRSSNSRCPLWTRSASSHSAAASRPCATRAP